MKRKHEDFFYWLNNLNLADFKSKYRFFESFLDQKLQPFGVHVFHNHIKIQKQAQRCLGRELKKCLKDDYILN